MEENINTPPFPSVTGVTVAAPTPAVVPAPNPRRAWLVKIQHDAGLEIEVHRSTGDALMQLQRKGELVVFEDGAVRRDLIASITEVPQFVDLDPISARQAYLVAEASLEALARGVNQDEDEDGDEPEGPAETLADTAMASYRQMAQPPQGRYRTAP